MKRIVILSVSVTLAAAMAVPAARPSKAEQAQQAKEAELARLKQSIESARDSLEREIAQRYTAKQRSIEQREADKEEMEKLRELQERAMNDLSRMKEETFAREQALEDARRIAQQKEEEWNFVKSSFDDILRKEADAVAECFPLEREARRAALEEIRRKHAARADPAATWRALVAYRSAFFSQADTISLSKQHVLPDEGAGGVMSVTRFGSVFAYCMEDSGAFFMIRQTGRMGAERYAIDKVLSPSLNSWLLGAYPSWLSAGGVHGGVLTEVMQNDQSRALVATGKRSRSTEIVRWYRAGGPVMVPLALMSLWAVVLMAIKLVSFARRHRSGVGLHKRIIALIDRKDIEAARAAAAGGRGIVSRIAQLCLGNAQWDRQSAERAVRELVTKEVPLLNQHLNSLAVIAGAAPLLGLLGTVTGMINLFDVITHYGTGDPKLLAGGISEALITTETGLAIAIPVILIHNYLRNRKEAIQAEMEHHAISILNRLWP